MTEHTRTPWPTFERLVICRTMYPPPAGSTGEVFTVCLEYPFVSAFEIFCPVILR
jgi:hypothetical protein